MMSFLNVGKIIKKILDIIIFPYLFFLSIVYFYISKKNKLVGFNFDSFGKRISWRYLKKIKINKFIRLFLNPVSITRYFEFDYALKNINKKEEIRVLDISSPRLFSMYINYYIKNIEYYMTNPDVDDLNESIEYSKLLDLDNIKFMNLNVLSLPFESNYFDYIIMISVLEHIPDPHDIASIKALWKLLKVNGKLIITFPVANNYFEEFRKNNTYKSKDIKKSDKGYFFQRFYDYNKIVERILKPLFLESIDNFEIFGEKEINFFKGYISRWIKKGYCETIKDPLYILRQYKYFNSFNELVDTGVAGLVLTKSN